MARAPDERYNKAYELFKAGNKLVEIANQLNLPEGTVRRWKSTHKWDNERSDIKSERSEKKSEQNKVKNKAVANEVNEVLENTELNDKQRLFCLYYVKSFNATRSYMKAYGCDEYTGMANGSRLLSKAKIKEEVYRLKQNRLNREMLSQEDLFQKYMDIAFADITDFLEFGREEVEVMGPFGPIMVEVEGEKEKVPLMKEVNVVKFKNSGELDGTLISEVKQGKDGASIKLHDRMKALEWLTVHMDMATERQRLEMAKLKYEVSQLSGGNNGDESVQAFLKAVKPSQEDIEAMFADEEEVIEDAEANKEE